MHCPRAFVACSLVAALAGTGTRAATLEETEQWRCQAAPAGGWHCATAPRPEGVFAPGVRPPREAPAIDAAAVDQRADALAQGMDWVARERLAPDQEAQIPVHCGGAYTEPPLAAPTSETTVFGTIHASAEESELLQGPEIARFSGNVTVRQDDRRLRADRATYYRAEERVEIEGEVQYREPGLLVRGERAAFRTNEQSGELDAARFVMHREHARGEAARVRRNTDRSIDLDEGTYTRCEPGHDDWQLAAGSIHLDRTTGKGTARHARLEVKGVPVIYTPYLQFPIDERRMTGFLWPTFTNSSQTGLDVALPYYLNLAPNMDATLVPRYLDDRGVLAGGEFRYLNRWSQWVASGAMLPDDDVYGDDRWLASLQQAGNLPKNLYTAIDYTEVSDEDYLRNLSAVGLEVKRSTHLAQSGAVAWMPGPDWMLSASAQQYQLLDTALDQPYKMLPRLELARSFTGKPFTPDFALAGEYTAFEHKDTARLTGQRLYLAPTASYPMEWAAGYVRPSAGYQSISYNLDESYTGTGDDAPSVGAPLLSLDSGYFLERTTRWFDTGLQQTLEPRAYYLWVDREDHSDLPNFDSQDLTFSFSQLFRPTRFSGHDRIADANQASLSLTSRLISDASGEELLSASIGQIFYFEDRAVTIANVPTAEQDESSSAVAAEVQVQPDRRVSVSGSTLWNPHEERVDEGGMMMHWTPGEETIVNLGYRYRRDQPFVAPDGSVRYDDIDQVDFSTALPLGQHWKLLARYQYDLANDSSLEETTGIEYSSCCWAVRMVYQEGVDWEQGRDYGFYVEFVLRGLGSLGKNIDQLLQKSIFGYGEFDRDYRLVN
jgi:LPS-assembly protein